MEAQGFFDESLHIDKKESVESILTSDVWRRWVDLIQHNPEKAPTVCHKKCKLQNDY